MKIFCKDCVHIVKPSGATYYPHPESLCLQSDVIDYVTGVRKHEFCKVKNTDGECPFHRAKGVK
jgi:hypothetical protein